MESSPQPGTQVLSTDTPELFETAVLRAAELLMAGEVVALPTETVYGLAANALDPKAVAKIFKIKGRPAHNPIIAHIADLNMAKRCVSDWPSVAEQLAKSFWPGPLTLILPRTKDIPDILTAGGRTVGIRWPSHPFMQSVIRKCGFPLAAPSANLSNRVSPTNVTHVQKQLGGKIPLIIDGGQCQVGIESTVLDVSESPPRLLRPGMIHRETLVAVVGALGGGQHHGTSPLKSPGLLQKHYAPRARLVVRSWNSDLELRTRIKDTGVPLLKAYVIAHTNIPSAEGLGGVSVIPHDAQAFARALYAQLHECDETGVELILVEALPETDEWRAVTDRLNRAATS